MFSISLLTNDYQSDIQAKIDNKTKPPGALGELESLAARIAVIQSHKEKEFAAKLSIKLPQLIVFAGDHGIAAEGVSIAPSEVTGQMVANFANGGAAINVFCREFGWQLSVVDAGILSPVEQSYDVLNQRLGAGTQAFYREKAMSETDVEKGLELGRTLAAEKAAQGSNLIAFGEMGIGNTSSAAAIMAAITKLPIEQCVGRGTGVDESIVVRKKVLIEQALSIHQDSMSSPEDILACVGGFEIVQMTGAMLGAAENKMAIVVDGFIATAAAMVAVSIEPAVKGYFIFSHCSGEKGHSKMLEWFDETPLLQLGLRLGEGTGAALSLPLIHAAVAFYNNMASFEEAQVTDVG